MAEVSLNLGVFTINFAPAKVTSTRARLRRNALHNGLCLIIERQSALALDVTQERTSGIRPVTIPRCFLRRATAEPGGIERFQALDCEVKEAFGPLEHEWRDFHHSYLNAAGSERDIVEHDLRIFSIRACRYDLFISHARVDTHAVAAPLDTAGSRVWIDQRFVTPRDDHVSPGESHLTVPQCIDP